MLSKQEFNERLAKYVAGDRVWKRHQRITYAMRCLRFAVADNRPDDARLYRAVLKLNNYDSEDKRWREARNG